MISYLRILHMMLMLFYVLKCMTYYIKVVYLSVPFHKKVSHWFAFDNYRLIKRNNGYGRNLDIMRWHLVVKWQLLRTDVGMFYFASQPTLIFASTTIQSVKPQTGDSAPHPTSHPLPPPPRTKKKRENQRSRI